MRAEVEKLKRYYNSGKISLASIEKLLEHGKITLEEYDYIIASDDAE